MDLKVFSGVSGLIDVALKDKQVEGQPSAAGRASGQTETAATSFGSIK